jgi:GAF domain-containing protein
LQHAPAEAHSQLAEALDQQAATSEILKAISGAHTDISSVFDAIARSAVKLCGAFACRVFRVEGELLPVVGEAYGTPDARALFHGTHSEAVGRDSPSGTAIRERRVVQYSDVPNDPGVPERYRERARARGYRALMAVPMVRAEVVLGTITVARQEAVPFSERQVALVKTFADQAVIAVENARLLAELQERNRALTHAHGQVTEALNQQTATAEILRVISGSPTDVQPVFDAIVRSTLALCHGKFCVAYRYDGENIHVAAHHNMNADVLRALAERYPSPPDRATTTGQTILDRQVIHVLDTLDPSVPVWSRDYAKLLGYRTLLSVPILKEGQPIGSIAVARADLQPFSDQQVALVKTFADQAVIAIENVRLFTELQQKNGALTEALEQQTATSDILRVMSSSPTDVQPVFEAIAENAARLVQAWSVTVLRWDGRLIHLVAERGGPPGSGQRLRDEAPWLPNTTSGPGRCIATGTIVHVPDVDLDPEADAATRELARMRGWRSDLNVPMLREGSPIGAISVTHVEAGPFSPAEIELLQTFADQAVIAIENVRLFTELQEKNRALAQAHIQMTETLEQQTATGEILRVISSSPTDLQPVLDAVAENAARVCEGQDASVLLVEGAALRRVAHTRGIPATVGDVYPLRRDTVMGRAVLDRRTLHVEDLLALAEQYPEGARHAAELGHRTTLATPLLREGEAIGALLIRRLDVRPFTHAQVTLLETFAAQAVIAIENVRLFNELREKNQALTVAHAQVTKALEQQTATSEILRAIAQTQTDAQPVFDTIVRAAARLCDAPVSALFLTDGRTLYHGADHGSSPEALAAQRGWFPRAVEMDTTPGMAILTRTVVHVPDTEEPSAPDFVRQSGRRLRFRTVIAVPMIRDGEPVGALSVTRRDAGRFSEAEVALLKTFADQAVIAIENVRLFNELELANRGLEAASRHKSEFLANMSHELRTPLNAILGFSEVLGERMFGELNEKQDEYLKDIHASGQHLLSLINDILDLSKIEAGRMELELADFHLPQAIDNALVLVRERALRRGITLEQAIDSRLGEIRGDERKIKQVLLNLLSNAIKFTPDGGRINVRAMLRDAIVEMSVSDTGVGIALEDQQAIFEEFQQVGTAAKRVEGTGLGLALSRKFIELHGGRIWVESQEGAGSTFTFAIPVRGSEES